jgi:inorganic phosphate transporter, PiT family
MHFFENLHFGSVNFAMLPGTVLALIALALLFDFLNGFHDAANSVATVVSTRVLSPQQAVIWAAFFNFIAFLIFNLKVAETMASGVIDPTIINNQVVAATLIAACAWDILTWYWGLPTSSSHALIGGMVGAALASAGWSSLVWWGIGKTALFIVVAPMLGLFAGLTIAVAVHWIFWKATPRGVDTFFRRGQLVSASLYSLGHGGNDAQKTMGIIFALLVATAAAQPESVAKPDSPRQPDAAPVIFTEPPTHARFPTEVVLACHLAMGLGTLFGGWRIVKTMGQRIIRLRPVDGFCAETGAAATLMVTVALGTPVSTTHTITGAIVGVGSLKRLSAVRWGVAGQVVWAWILTIPGAALISAICLWLLKLASD